MKNIYWFIGTILFLLVVNLASAQSGCFFYSESQLYCLDMIPEEAEQECSLYEGCSLEQYYYQDKSCSDFSTFPFCDKAVCKSSCQEDFLGKCYGGIVPLGSEETWCSSGCCRFDYYQQSYCGFKSNKWLCELEARNKDAEFFNFDNAFDSETCLELCQQTPVEGMEITAGLNLEKVSDESELSFNLPEIPPQEEAVLENASSLSTDESSFGWLWTVLVILGILLLLLVVYILYQQNQFRRQKQVGKISAQEEDRFKLPIYLVSPFLTQKMKFLREKYRLRHKDKTRENFLAEFGLLPPKIPETELVKLKQLVRGYERKKRFFLKKKLTEGEKAIEKLEKLVFEKSKTKYDRSQAVKRKEWLKSEQDKVIDELRRIVGR